MEGAAQVDGVFLAHRSGDECVMRPTVCIKYACAVPKYACAVPCALR